MTEDLPTPPLPDEISNGRVFAPGWLNGTGPAGGVTLGLRRGRGRMAVAVQPDAQLLALVVGHHRELEVDAG